MVSTHTSSSLTIKAKKVLIMQECYIGVFDAQHFRNTSHIADCLIVFLQKVCLRLMFRLSLYCGVVKVSDWPS